MADIDVKQLTGRLDTVLDILVAGDYQSAIRNLEILKLNYSTLITRINPHLLATLKHPGKSD
jgi:hypothetical protein